MVSAALRGFKSYHFGIETRKADFRGGIYRTLNRTILELKRDFLCFALGFTLALNRTILELKLKSRAVAKYGLRFFKSYHFGIETKDFYMHNYRLLDALNRTILELKRNCQNDCSLFANL